MKSKSQIHSLVANARSSENERARMDSMRIGKSGKSTLEGRFKMEIWVVNTSMCVFDIGWVA